MRLLELQSHGEPRLVGALPPHVPPYAILSHTWGEGEVTYKHCQTGLATAQAGYRKIRFCAEQARRDNISYIWVDSCCIDSSSSAELTEGINSMYRWYQEAVCCYVYLADVACTDARKGNWQVAFLKSRWFKRGWTLQELLAPTKLFFFSNTGVLLGTRQSLGEMIHQVTHIPMDVLRKTKPLSEIDTEELFRWMEGRGTLRPEDRSYSMLGMFDVHMGASYGEGGKNARQRLQDELDQVSMRSRVHSPYVGGMGGTNFSLLAPAGQKICELHLWSARDHMQAIRVKYTNGQEELIGRVYGNNKYLHFVFNQGERIKRLVLWDNHDGGRLGGISFTTTDNRSVDFGLSKRRKLEWVNEPCKRLVGICGTAGRDIDRLAFVFSW